MSDLSALYQANMWLSIEVVTFSVLLAIFIGISLILISLTIAKVLTEPTKGMCKCRTLLDGKIVLVTGGNSGIGFETAKDLARRGARVIIADVNDAEESVKKIINSTGNEKVEYRHLDLADFDNIRAFADELNRTIDHLDILVNNAGCLLLKKLITKDGIDKMMQTNYLGPFLLTNLILGKIVKRRSRIVIVSSGVYSFGELDLQDLTGWKPKNFFKCYMNSKLCTVLWTKALAKRLPANVSVFCLHPGMVSTNILAFANNSVCDMMKKWAINLVKSPYEGAQTSIHVCVARNIEKVSGGYFSNCKLTPTANIVHDNSLIDELWNETILLLKDRNMKMV